MKTKVMVTLRAEVEVEYVTEHAEDESSTDLLPAEQREVLSLASRTQPRWEIERVKEVGT